MLKFNIRPVDRTMEPAIKEKIDNLTKPKGSLGRLEELACKIALIQQTLFPEQRYTQGSDLATTEPFLQRRCRN